MDTPRAETGPEAPCTLGSLSRFLDPADYDRLAAELVVVDRHWDTKQHRSRRWEYALALRAVQLVRPHGVRRFVDVGGGGSPFWMMAGDRFGHLVEVVDPSNGGLALDEYLWLCPALADAVTCLSVLEHVPDEAQFLYHLSCLVAPGGVLVLTMDAVGENVVQDTYHFSWMRQRIYTPQRLGGVLAQLLPLGLVPEAWPDFAYPGPQVYDYSAASLVLRKRP